MQQWELLIFLFHLFLTTTTISWGDLLDSL